MMGLSVVVMRVMSDIVGDGGGWVDTLLSLLSILFFGETECCYDADMLRIY